MMRRLSVLLLGLVLLMPIGGPAQAHSKGSIYEQGRYNEPYSFTDEDCAFPFEVKGRRWGWFVVRNVRGSDGQAFLVEDHFRFGEVLTNPANGKSMRIWGRGVFKEHSAKHIEGDIWEFISTTTGIPFVVQKSSGKVLVKDIGQVTFRTVFDTLGDSQPGGEFVEDELLKIRGRFPSLDADFDFCAVVEKAIG